MYATESEDSVPPVLGKSLEFDRRDVVWDTAKEPGQYSESADDGKHARIN